MEATPNSFIKSFEKIIKKSHHELNALLEIYNPKGKDIRYTYWDLREKIHSILMEDISQIIDLMENHQEEETDLLNRLCKSLVSLMRERGLKNIEIVNIVNIYKGPIKDIKNTIEELFDPIYEAIEKATLSSEKQIEEKLFDAREALKEKIDTYKLASYGLSLDILESNEVKLYGTTLIQLKDMLDNISIKIIDGMRRFNQENLIQREKNLLRIAIEEYKGRRLYKENELISYLEQYAFNKEEFDRFLKDKEQEKTVNIPYQSRVNSTERLYIESERSYMRRNSDKPPSYEEIHDNHFISSSHAPAPSFKMAIKSKR